MQKSKLEMKVLKAVALVVLHVVLICFVILIPVVVYDQVTRLQLPNSLLFIGGLTYPAYIGYWVHRIPWDRIRIILLHLIGFFTISFFIVSTELLGDTPIGALIALLPSLMLAIIQWQRGAKVQAKSHRIAFYLLVGPTLVLTAVQLYYYSLGQAMKGMHY